MRNTPPVAAVLGLCCATACAQNLVQNGGFEQYELPAASWSLPGIADLNIPVGSTRLVGWEVLGSPDYVGTGWQPGEGERSLDMAGTPAIGHIRQSVALTPGREYVLSFRYSGNPDATMVFREPPIKELEASIAGLTFVALFDTEAMGNSPANMMWARVGRPFIATGATEVLTFRSIGPQVHTGPALDDVAITPRCPADLTEFALPGTPGYGLANAILNNDDFFYFLAQFAAGNLAVADLTTTAVPGTPGYGVPNGVLNNDDFFFYLAIFAAGC
ncbi:MAG: GC-type dockerin domain-anchored protein [Phycisphaerales bacterium]